MPIEDPVVREASPTAKLVYQELQLADEPLAQHELVARTGSSERNIRRRLDDLLNAGVVEISRNDTDLRERRYAIVSEGENTGQ